MTTKTNWDLLTEEEQGAYIDALDKSTTDAGICIADQDIDEVVDYVAKLAINALPARLFGPRLPEGWRIERKGGLSMTVIASDGTSAKIYRTPRNGVICGLLSALLAQEGE